MKRMVFAPNSNHVYVGGAYSIEGGHHGRDHPVRSRGRRHAHAARDAGGKDGCIAWTNGPHSAGSCRKARAIGLITAWTMSPDGKKLYVVGDQQGIAIIDRDTTTGLLSEHAVPNGCITETGHSPSAAATAGQCRVGGYALRRSPTSP